MKRLTRLGPRTYCCEPVAETNCENCPKHNRGCYDSSDCVDVLVERLAAYEDTGLEPGEVPSALELAKMACVIQKLQAYERTGLEPEEITQLKKDHLEICDSEWCAGDESVGIPACRYWECGDVDEDGMHIIPHCRLKEGKTS